MQATPSKFTVVNVLSFDSKTGDNLSPLVGYTGSLYNFGNTIRGKISLTRESIARSLNSKAVVNPGEDIRLTELNPLIAVMCEVGSVDNVVGYIHEVLGDEVSLLAEVVPEKFIPYFVKSLALKQVSSILQTSTDPREKDNQAKLRDRGRDLISEFGNDNNSQVTVGGNTVAILINPQTVMVSASSLFNRTWIRMGNELLETDSLLANSFIACDQFESITKQCITCKYSLGDCLDYTSKIAGYSDLNISKTNKYSSKAVDLTISSKVVTNSVDKGLDITKSLSSKLDLMSKYGLEYIKPVFAINEYNASTLVAPNMANVDLSEENVARNIDYKKTLMNTAMKTRMHKSRECSKCSIRETCSNSKEYKEFVKFFCKGAVRPPKNTTNVDTVLSLLADSKDVYKYMVYLPGTKLEKPIVSSDYSHHYNKIAAWNSVIVASVTHSSLVQEDKNTFIIKSIDDLDELMYQSRDFAVRMQKNNWSTKGLAETLADHTIAKRVLKLNQYKSSHMASNWVCRLSFTGYSFKWISGLTVFMSLPIVMDMVGHVYSDPKILGELQYHAEGTHVSFGSCNPMGNYGSETPILPIKSELLEEYYTKFSPKDSSDNRGWSMIRLKDQISYLVDPLFDRHDADLYLKSTNITHRSEYRNGGFGSYSGYDLNDDCLLLLQPRLGGVILTSARLFTAGRQSYLTCSEDAKLRGYGGSMLETRNLPLFYKWNPISVVGHTVSFSENNVFRKSPSNSVWRYMSETFPVDNTVSSILHACEMSGSDTAILVPAKESKKFSIHGIKKTKRYSSYRKIPTAKSEIISVMPSNPLPGFTKLYNHITSHMMLTGSYEYKNDASFRAIIARKLITELHALLKVNVGYRNIVCDTTGEITVIPAEIPYLMYSEEIPLITVDEHDPSRRFSLDADILENESIDKLYKMQRKEGMASYHKSLHRAMHLRVLKLKNTRFIPTQDKESVLGRITRQSSVYEVSDGLTGLLTTSSHNMSKYRHVGILKNPNVIATLTVMSNTVKTDYSFSLQRLYDNLKKD